MKKRLIALFIAAIMMLPTNIAFSAGQSYTPDVQYEFEDTDFSRSYDIYKHSAASGRRYIATDLSMTNSPPGNEDITLNFTADGDKDYYLWLRYCAPTTSNAALYIALDGEVLSQRSFTLAKTGDGVWLWANARTINAKAGANSVRIASNHNGLCLDSFIISGNASFIPPELAELNKIKKEYDALIEAQKYKIAPNPEKMAEFTDGIAHCELEDFISLEADHVIFADNTLSGKKGIRFTKWISAPDTTYPEEPIVKITFEAKKDTPYYFWLRYGGRDSNTDIFYYKIDNSSNYKSVALGMLPKNEYGWLMFSASNFEEGIHTLNIVSRTSDLCMDKVVISSEAMYYPSGLGEWNKTERTEGRIVYTTDKKPIDEHPRVLFTKADIPEILENAKKSENAGAWTQLLKYAESTQYEPTVNLSSYSADLIKAIDSKAFYYAIYGDEKIGREAIDYLINFISLKRSIATNDYTTKGETTYLIALVYDWCYPLLTDAEKIYFQNQVITIAQTNETKWPPTNSSSIVGHLQENIFMRDLVAAAIAMYGDSEEIYQNVMGRFFDEYVPSRKFVNQSGLYIPGQYYFNYRFQWEVMSMILIDKAFGIKSVFGEGTRNMINYERYSRRPDGSSLMDGDKTWNNNAPGSYHSLNQRVYLYLASYYNDPGIKYEFIKTSKAIGPTSTGTHTLITPAEHLILNDPDVGCVDATSSLPLTRYFGFPYGTMVARTGWENGMNAKDVLVQMKVGMYNFGDHQHLDAGGFTVYYKGGLANDTGYYQAASYDTNTNYRLENDGNTHWATKHDGNYMTRTIAHNCMLVYDPEEVFPNKGGSYDIAVENDGGQEYKQGYTAPNTVEAFNENPDKWKTGEVLGAEYGKDLHEPDWSYIKGDISDAYSDKVEEYERSFMFLNLKNEDVPGALIVFDRIKSSDASFKKTWLLHTKDVPTVEDNRSVATVTDDGYNGRIVLDTLLPEKDNIAINVVEGGEGDAWVNGTNYFAKVVEGGLNEGGGSRIEISPKAEANEDIFLNVMQVSDADGTVILPTQKIETPTHAGVVISDRVVLFSKQRDRISDDISFEISADGKYQITVADCAEGTWGILCDGKPVSEAAASKDGGVLAFEGTKGSYTLKYTGNESITDTDNDGDLPETETMLHDIPNLIKVNDRYMFFENEVIMLDNANWVSAEEMMNFIGYKGSYDSHAGRLTVSADGHQYTFIKDADYFIFDDSVADLGYTAREINSELYLPLRFLGNVFSAEFSYNAVGRIANAVVNTDLEQSEEIGVTPLGGNVYQLSNVAEIYDLKVKFKALGDNPTYSVMVSTDGEVWRSAVEAESVIAGFDDKYMLTNPYANAGFIKLETNGCTADDIRISGRRISGMELHIVSCTESEANKGVEVGANTYDRDSATLWAAEGDDEWIVYEFDRAMNFDGIEIMWNNGSARVAYFDILVSDDGENWTYALKDGASSGVSTALEKYDFEKTAGGKFLKINCHGNSTSKWNGIKEVNLIFK